jgi:hypothetical protein
MTVPWTGFPMTELLKIAEPLGSAKYLAFETVQDNSMGGLSVPLYPWPYVDGLAIDEAANELAFMTTGMYGKPLPPQNGGPIRMTTPWKYGFKQVKSIVKVTFMDKRPRCFWQEINASEYGFWANVNPDVSHPRWSQARERLAGLGRDGADQNLQWLRRLRRQLVFRSQVREVVHVNAQRTLAVLAAVLFVGAVGLATVGPEMVTLGTAVAYISPTRVRLDCTIGSFASSVSGPGIMSPTHC